ncbi:MAG: cobalt-precorrin-5B (C(1))-methyltransferase CbiD [Thermodesulfovibrionales bacterium]
MGSKSRQLRSGYTTGACAAAASKAAVTILCGTIHARADGAPELTSELLETIIPKQVEIPFPDGSRHIFRIHDAGFTLGDNTAWASVIKDAGDDPDITNGAEIRSDAAMRDDHNNTGLIIRGGTGVGTVTRPGLPVRIGEPAINPGPTRMIQEAVSEARKEANFSGMQGLEVTISVPDGERLAKKTLNTRLGIVGGLSILGSTGIVRPISTEAWTATISASMDVARAMGHTEIVLSSGRTSEHAHMAHYKLPEEMYVMMGDYLEYALRAAAEHDFSRIHLSAQWAKMLKIAMVTPQTHVRHGALDTKKAAEFVKALGAPIDKDVSEFNTAREILDLLLASPLNKSINNTGAILSSVCAAAKQFAESFTNGVPVTIYLISYEGTVIALYE